MCALQAIIVSACDPLFDVHICSQIIMDEEEKGSSSLFSFRFRWLRRCAAVAIVAVLI